MKFDRDNNRYEQCVPQQPVTLTPGFIKKWYEINPDTNAFTDADKYKLDNITNGKDGLDGKDGKDGTDGINGTDGTNGKDGKEGQQGIPGSEGPQGLQGDKGIPGTNTPAPGPKGDKGAKGDKGDRGTNGTDGIIGKDGVDGAGGLKGDKGDTGDRGLAGPQGVKGSTGSEGPRGPKGLDGQNGSLGNAGPVGPTGSAGKDGTGVKVKGSDTKANIQAKTGAAGDMWIITDVGPDLGKGLVSDGNGSGIAHWTDVGHIAGPKGDTGATGQTGANGSNGADSTVAGPRGPKGANGGQGIQGVKGDASTVPGPTGQQGIRGEKGDTGIDGPKGDTGATGATGPQGPKGDSGSGSGGGSLSPEDQAKLDAIQVGPNNMTLDKNVILVGDGSKAVGIKLHNPSTEEAIIQGDGSKGAWYIGSFPKSGVHPDDLVLSNSTGGLFTSIADGAKWSVRYGTDIVSFTKAELQAVKAGGGGTGTPGPKGDKGDAGKDGVDGKPGVKGDKGDTGPQGTPGTGGGSGLDPADKTKLDFLTVTKAADIDAIAKKTGLIDGTTGINFDEVILDGDRATVSDIDDPAAAPATLLRFVSIEGLRHGLTQFGKIMGTTYEHLLGNPTKDDQILSSKKDGTRSWIDAPSGGAGIAPADQDKLDHITVTKDIDLGTVSTVQHLHGTTVPADTLGKDNDTYFKIA